MENCNILAAWWQYIWMSFSKMFSLCLFVSELGTFQEKQWSTKENLWMSVLRYTCCWIPANILAHPQSFFKFLYSIPYIDTVFCKCMLYTILMWHIWHCGVEIPDCICMDTLKYVIWMDVVHVYQNKLTVKKCLKKMYITCKKRKNSMFCECYIMCVVLGYNVEYVGRVKKIILPNKKEMLFINHLFFLCVSSLVNPLLVNCSIACLYLNLVLSDLL